MTDTLPHGWIDHVIYLMLENRGFDHFLGWLYPPQGNDAPPYTINSYATDQRPFIGLSDALIAQLTNPYPNNQAAPQPVIKGARSPKTPSHNSGEDFPHIMNQMWGLDDPVERWQDPGKWGPVVQGLKQRLAAAPMNGYILDYNLELQHEGVKHPAPSQLSEIVETYLPVQLPVLAGLAQSFAVSDEWYCSVPSQTNTNRAFSLTGTSRGMVNNGFYTPHAYNPEVRIIEQFKSLHTDALPRSTGSLFEVLQASGVSWKIFWQRTWPPRYLTAGVAWQYTRTLIPALEDTQFDGNFVRFDADKDDNALFTAIREGKLPALTYIEPRWGGGASWTAKKRLVGNEYHPVCDTTVAEDFLRRLYEVLAASDTEGKILLVITFDENGGTYDHVVPPAAPAPANESVPLPHAPHDKPGLYNAISPTAAAVPSDPTTRTQFGFDFKSYGIRVPTILVSNRLPPKTVFRSTVQGKVFDHTSIIASVLEMADIPRERWLLGQRVLEAPTFTHLFEGVAPPIVNRSKPLSINAMRSGNPRNVPANTPVRLAYVGSLWPQAGNTVYLGPQAWGAREYYPTFVGQDAAVSYRLSPLQGGVAGVIPNMSKVRITAEVPALGINNLLRAAWSNHNVFFSGQKNDSGEQWEIRLLQSRDPGDVIRYDDYVAIFSCLSAHVGAWVNDMTTPDPFQRLMPDPGNTSYATTAAGEWALWQIKEAP